MTGIFDNAESVVINGNEVQSIIDSNGGVIYQKHLENNYLLTLTSDKDILSYYDNDSALLTVTLTNNGVGVQGEIVRFDGFLLDAPITRSITQNTETYVGNKYILSNIPITNLNKIFLNKEHTVYITKDAIDGVKIYWPNGGSGEGTSNISVENGIIAYTKNGTDHSIDCSNIDMSVIYSQVNGLVIQDYGIFGTTDSNGQATATYNSHGVGYITITAKCMNMQSEAYKLIDAKYYASNETINLAPRYENNRELFASDYQIQEGDKIHFRFKNITNHMLWGIGSTAGSDFTFEQVGTQLKYWRNVLGNGSYNNPSFLATTENDYIFEYLKYDSTQWKVDIYIGDRYVNYWRCGHTIRRVRVDKYDDSNPPWNVEVFVL